jgi:hypothetical protein
MVRDNERSNATKELDKEQQKLQDQKEQLESPANINKVIQDALTTGIMNLGTETIKTQDAITDMINGTTIGYQTITSKVNEYIQSLGTAIELSSKLGDINSHLGYTSTYTPSNPINNPNTYANLNTSKSVDVKNTYTINVQGDVTQDNLSAIQDMIKQSENYIFTKINNET